jgi:modulator of FtsH protease
MMIDAWANFFIAQCGASAALLGLLFVSVSLSLGKILAFPVLPGRALTAMLLLLAVLLVSSFLLIPGQPIAAIGIEVLGVGFPLCGASAVIGIRGMRNSTPDHRREFVSSFVFLAVATLPYLAAGILFVTGGAAAPYCLAAAIILSYLKAFLDAWVLLIEIHR